MAHMTQLPYPIPLSDTTDQSRLSDSGLVLRILFNMTFSLATANGQELALKLKSNCHPELDDGQGNRFQLRVVFSWWWLSTIS